MVPRTRLIRRLIFLCLMLTLFASVSAQEDSVTVEEIFPGAAVFDTITVESFYDRWEFYASAGDQYSAEMIASDGLAPLIGLQDNSGDIVTASNLFDDGSIIDAEPDGRAMIFFEIPTDGIYALIATRAGMADGATTGSYSLVLNLLGTDEETISDHLDVSFRCGADIVTSALGIYIEDASENTREFHVSVFGFDDFTPVLRIGGNDGLTNPPCLLAETLDSPLDFILTLADGETQTFDRVPPQRARYDFDMQQPGNPFITIAAPAGASGYYAVYLRGLGIETPNDIDRITLFSGPRAKDAPIWLWMLAEGLTRLDPFMSVLDGLPYCNDIGLRTCRTAVANSGILAADPAATVLTTDRLDAAVLIDTQSIEPVTIALMSGSTQTTGSYGVWIFGYFPPINTAAQD